MKRLEFKTVTSIPLAKDGSVGTKYRFAILVKFASSLLQYGAELLFRVRVALIAADAVGA